MVKKIVALCLLIVLSFSTLSFTAIATNSVSSAGGQVSINYEIGKADTPVIMVVLPPILESETDVTSAKMAALKTDLTALKNMPLAYAKIIKTNSEGVLNHTCMVNSSLPTGLAYVYISYMGAENWILAGSFEHVSSEDITRLLGWFNEGAAPYETIITWDEEGKDGEPSVPAVQILRKSSAKVDAYLTFGTAKSTFCDILSGKKPVDGFSIMNLVSLFNESVAWTELRLLDTLTVLRNYNGVYWNLPLGEADDFMHLSESEKTRMLTNIKTGGYADGSTLESNFMKELALSMFRDAKTREELESVIDSEGTYSSYFASVRSILSEAALDSYESAEVMNAVLNYNSNCPSLENAAILFTNALPADGDADSGFDDDYSNLGTVGVSNRGGGGMGIAKPKEPEKPTEPEKTEGFNDVAKNHWASSYITRLYNEKVINGTGEGKFLPASPIRRQDFVKILIGALGMEQTDSKSTFADVASGNYYEPFIMTAVEKGLIFGVGENSFGGAANISREDAAVIMSRTLKLYGKTEAGEGISFVDFETSSDYAKEAIEFVSGFGIFSGDEQGNFNPKAELSRAEACAILCRLADLVEGGVK